MSKVFGSTDGLNPQGGDLPQNADADQLGIGSGQLMARKALQGGIKGLGSSMQSQPQAQGGGMPANFNVQGTQLPDAYYQNLQPQQMRSRALFGQ